MLYYNITAVHAVDRPFCPTAETGITWPFLNATTDRRDQTPVMTEDPDPAKCPADPERSPSLREWLIDTLAFAMGGLAVYHYKPDGFLAGLIMFVGAYTFTHSL